MVYLIKVRLLCAFYRVMKWPLLLISVTLVCANLYSETTQVKDGVISVHPAVHLTKRYEPKWEDLDTRPLPEWYDRAKVGIFLHWGVFSVPSFGSEWFWNNWNSKNDSYVEFMTKNYVPGFTYQDFAPMFTAEFFDPSKWAELFKKAGAKYIVLTSKHHEGFTLFPSRRSFSWNAVDVGPKRDLVKDLATAVREQGMKFGVYHSLYEWFNPIYLEDKNALFETRNYPETKLWPDLMQLVNEYKPSVIWSDGDWEALDSYWNSTEFLAYLYNESPVKDEIVVNDRWGIGTYCKHGDFYNCADRFNPGILQKHKWENAFTVDNKSWGYRRNIELSEIMNITSILKEMVVSVSCGGNVLINVGPTKEGTIAPIFQERLLTLGDWLSTNGEAIYETSPWKSQNDTMNGDVWYTCRKSQFNAAHPTAKPTRADTITAVYAILLKWPEDNILRVRDLGLYLQSGKYHVELLGNPGVVLVWKIVSGKANIRLLDKSKVKSENAWVLKITQKKDFHPNSL